MRPVPALYTRRFVEVLSGFKNWVACHGLVSAQSRRLKRVELDPATHAAGLSAALKVEPEPGNVPAQLDGRGWRSRPLFLKRLQKGAAAIAQALAAVRAIGED
jgi:hypothetical protein